MEERWLLLTVRRTAIVTKTRHDRAVALMWQRAVCTVSAAEANALDLLVRGRLSTVATNERWGHGS